MTSRKAPKSFKVGGVMTPRVTQQHIDKSAPCNKDSCMLSEGFVDHLTEKFNACGLHKFAMSKLSDVWAFAICQIRAHAQGG
jgi:hypothetical protein